MSLRERSDTVEAPDRVRIMLLRMGVAVTALGLLLSSATVVAPDAVEKISGNLKVALERQVAAWMAPDALPTITLGEPGDTRDLDRCNGEFTEMLSYRAVGILPLYSAQHNCGGDITLGWDAATTIRVNGTE